MGALTRSSSFFSNFFFSLDLVGSGCAGSDGAVGFSGGAMAAAADRFPGELGLGENRSRGGESCLLPVCCGRRWRRWGAEEGGIPALLACCGVAVLLFRFRLAPPPRMDVGRIASTKKRINVGRTMDMVGPHLTRLMGYSLGSADTEKCQAEYYIRALSKINYKFI
jgi:hypothetical protein